jgi:hypothetical protein
LITSLGAMLFAACNDDLGPIVTADDPPDAGCIRPKTPQTYQVYFVVDVSGSMGPFLTDLKNELVTFAGGFPELDAEGRPVRVDYYVVAFVNDVKWYGGRMTSVIALQDALEQAIERGQTNLNLTQNRLNSEVEENTLDALASVIESNPNAEARLILLANDAPFLEAPAVLSDGIMIKSTYASILMQLQGIEARMHAFVPEALDGLTRSYSGHPALTSLPGSTVNYLHDLAGANDRIRETLNIIARGAACN